MSTAQDAIRNYALASSDKMSTLDSSNMDFLTRKMPNNWWTRLLRSSQASRVSAIHALSTTPIPADRNLCEICRAIEWEYLFIGLNDTGFKRSSNETVCLGLRSGVEQRGSKGCDICNVIVRPLIKEIDNERDQESDVSKRAEECVHFDVSDVHTQETVQERHASYCADVSVRSSNGQDGNRRHEVGIFYEDKTDSSAKKRIINKPALVLVDSSTLSAYQSVPPRVDFSRCKGWLEGCSERHSLCNEVYTRDEGSPIKLIDVLRGCVVSFVRKGDTKYAALSYVCGPGYSLCVLGESEAWFPDEDGNICHMLPEEIPATIQDTMTFTEKLGLRYLWVDSICIAQDNEEEKTTQIGLMYSIYSDATVTIVSAAGEDSHTPLAGVSSRRTHLPGRKVMIKEGMSLGLTFPSFGGVLSHYRYMRRAWTYQELLLSKRMFFFTSHEVFYYCAMTTSRESRVDQRDGHPEAASWADPTPEFSRSVSIGNIVTMRQTKGLAELCRLFTAIAQEYSSRELSYQEDTINAFKGVEGLFKQLINNERAVVGCPHPMLLHCLTWREPRINTPTSQHPKRRMCTKKLEVAVLPTWVWCSYDGPVKMNILRDCYPQSVCRFYVSDPMLKEMSRILPKIARGTGCVCNKPEHNVKIENYLPLTIRTRTAKVMVVADGDDDMIPGQADLSTTSGVYLGPCDFRGQARLDQINESEVTFVQLFQRATGMVTVLVLNTCRVLNACDDGINNSHNSTSSSLREFLTKLLVPEHEVEQIATVDSTANNSTTTTVKGAGKTCSEAAIIDGGLVPELEDVLVGSRMGIAHMSGEEWALLRPRESVVILI